MDPDDPRRAIHHDIQAILTDPAQRGARLLETLTTLGAGQEIEPFRRALQCLIHIDRSEEQSRGLFESIERHRGALEARLGRDPGLPVTALDLLHEIDGSLRDPIFREATASDLAPEVDRSAPSPADLFDEILAREVRRGERFGRPMTVAILAPDGIPESGGDPTERAATVLREFCRDCDHSARLLPEGYALLLPCTGGAEAVAAAERLRRALRIPTGVSWSAGIASCPDQGWDAAAVASGARRALATARESGGDVVRAFRPERRAHARRRPAGPVLAALLRWDGGEARAEIEDLSLGGAQLRVTTPIAPEARVTLSMRERSARPREAVLASRVTRRETVEAPIGPPQFRLGISFVDPSGGRLRVAALLSGLAETPAAGSGRA